MQLSHSNLQNLLLVALTFGLCMHGEAQTPVTTINVSNVPATPSTYVEGGVTYEWGQGNDVVIQSIEIGTETFAYDPIRTPDSVVFRRVDNAISSGSRTRLMANRISNTSYECTYPPIGADGTPMEAALIEPIINRGPLDLFHNVNAGSQNANNIERVDVMYSAITIPNVDLTKVGFIVSEKSGNNGYKIAAITSFNGAGEPASYSTLVTVDNGDYGLPNPSLNWRFLENAATPPHGLPEGYGGSNESYGFALVSFADLGLSVGDVIYGISGFGFDVTGTGTQVLTDWTTFPTNTSEGADIHGAFGSLVISTNITLDDSDNDGYTDDVDLDDDNDGILDAFECPIQLTDTFTFSANSGGTFSNSFISGVGYFLMDMYTLDNSFSITVNGVNVAGEFEFQEGTPNVVTFLDGFQHGENGVPEIWQLAGSPDTPLVRVTIDPNGYLAVFGARTSNGPLFPMQLTTPANQVVWNTSGTNDISIGQAVIGPTNMYGFAQFTLICDSDNDGIQNYLDTDSDEDGCPDALEGDGAFGASNLQNGSLTGGVDTTGVPIIASGGQFDISSVNASVTSGQCDDDNDGVINVNDICPGFDDSLDADADNIPDACDLDDDNDGILDSVECGTPPNADFVFLTPDFLDVITGGSAGSINLTKDISADFGLSTGSVIVTVENGNAVGTPLSFRVHPDYPTKFTFTGTVPVYLRTGHGSALEDNGDRDGFVVLDGQTFTVNSTPEPGYQFLNNGPDYFCEVADETLTDGTQSMSWSSDGTCTGVEFYSTNVFSYGSAVNLRIAPVCDSDLDGIPDSIDPDSDNDGCPDVTEAQINDPNQDGIPGTTPVLVDANGLVTGSAVDSAYIGITAFVQDPTISMCDPQAADDNYSTNEETPFSAYVGSNDSSALVDSTLFTFQILNAGTASSNGNLVFNSDGTFSFGPNTNFAGNAFFEYLMCSKTLPVYCDTGTVNITVNEVNDPPSINDQTTVLTEDDQNVNVDLLGNDSDPDGMLLPGSVQVLGGPNNGIFTLNGNGSVDYTPSLDFNGNDTITYLVCDNGTPQLCDSAIHVLVVLPVNDAPVALNDTYSLAEDSVITSSVATNDSDVDNIPSQMTLSLVDSSTAGQNGQIFFNNNGTFTYVPDPGFNGIVSFTYQICDPGPLCDTATVTLNYADVNDGPVALNDTTSTNEEVPVTFDPLVNDFDTDGQLDTATVQIFGPVNNGTAVVNANGTITFTPDSNYVGTADFQYVVCDNGVPVICDTAAVIVNVGPVNDPPVAANDAFNVNEDDVLSGADLTGNDSDIDNIVADLTWSLLNGGSAATNGTLTVNSNGTFDYTPNLNFNGTVSFDYLLCDNGMPQLCDTATATIFVDPVQDTIIANDDFDNTTPGAVVTSNVVANDVDTADAGGGVDPGSIIIITSSQNGVDSANANGTISYTPDSSFVGLDSIQYVVCDFGNPLPVTCDTAWFFIDVQTSGILAFDDFVFGTEDSTLIIDVLDNDSAGTAGIDTLIIIDPPINGTVVVNANGTISFVPDPGWNGTDDFTYQICDSLGICSNATVNVTINPVNDPPVLVDDNATTAEDTPVIIDVLANDSDPLDPLGNMDTTSVVIIGGPTNGTAVVNANGTITYTPGLNYNGADTITYVACDDGNGPPPICDTASVFINVTPVNDGPTAIDGTGSPTDTLLYSTPEDIPLLACIAAIDPENNGADVTGFSNGPSNGILSGIADGDTCFTYTPDPNFFGNDTVTIILCDSLGACDSVVAIITVTPINDAPNANTDFVTVGINAMGAGINVQDNDTDPDGDPLTTTIVSGPTSGGVATVSNDSIIYTPPMGFVGIDTIIYQICDPGPLCDTDSVFINIAAVEICDDGIDNDGNGLIDCLDPACDNFTGCDSVFACTNEFYQSYFGYLTNFDAATSSYDTLGLSTTGTYNALGYNSEDGSLYGLSPIDELVQVFPDGTTQVIDTVDVQGPMAAGDFDESGNLFAKRFDAGSPIYSVDVSTLATDSILPAVDMRVGDMVFNVVDGLFYAMQGASIGGGAQHLFAFDPLDTNPATAVVDLGVVAGATCSDNYGAAWTDSTGGLYFACNATGEIFSINEDALTAGVVATGNPTTNNDGANCHFIAPPFPVGPNAIVDFANVSIGATNVTIDLAANDTDPNGDLNLGSIVINSGPTSGGAVVVNGNGTIDYTPPTGFVGNDTIVYTICDQTAPTPLCDSDTLFVTVSNQAPIIVDPMGTPIDTLLVSGVEDNLMIICIDALDADGDSLDVTAFFNGPLNGTITGVADNDTCFTYTPNGNFSGNDTLTVVVCDPFGACDSAVVVIDINGVNDLPWITDDSTTTIEDTPINIAVLVNDFDSSDATGGIDTTSLVVVAGPNNGTVIINANGTIDYTPDPNWNGVDTFLYVVCDNGIPSPPLCDTAQVIVVVTPVNDDPIITNGGGTPIDSLVVSVLTGVPTQLCLNALDVDGDPVDITAIINGPDSGMVTGIADGDTCITYTSNIGYLGNDTLTAIVCDTLGACDSVIIIINVTDNDPPIAVDDTTTAVSGTTTTIDNLANDSDPNGDPFTTTSASASNGTAVVNANGTIDYTPNANFCGTDTISYTVCDSLGACDSALVFVDVLCAPIAVDDAAVTNEDQAVDIDVLINDSDPNGDPITVTSASANNGTTVINMNGTITYTPNPGYCGTDTLFYTICDITGLCDDAFVVIDVICGNDPPIGTNDSLVVTVNTSGTIDVLGNDSDPNGDVLSVDTAYAQNGSVVNNNDGTVTYIPNPDYCGPDVITYVVCDPTPDCDTAFVNVDIPCPIADFVIPGGISPNNDGMNDVWELQGIEEYPALSVRIFNRWGNEVFSEQPYNNNWAGENNQGELFGDALPVGTYWYIIDLNDGSGTTYNGYVYLNR